jgi:regulator of protease activity HflC (stomatin/prohibitin superfamily)
MKRVRINAQKVGLVYRNGDFKKALTAGNHWIRINDNYSILSQNQIYGLLDHMELVLKDETFSNLVETVTVKEHEIALLYIRDQFTSVITSGNYFYLKGDAKLNAQIINLNQQEEITHIDRAILNMPQVRPYVKRFKVERYESGLLFQDGQFIKELTNGTFQFWAGTKALEIIHVDLRVAQLEISGQELLTKDKAALRINFQLEYQVVDGVKAFLENRDYIKQLYTKAQLALREYVGALTLDELLVSKQKVADYVLEAIKTKSENLGIAVFNAGIRDIILPGEVKEIMNKVLIAEKQAQANTIARREETAATRTLLNSAKLMEENQVLYKLKEMEFIERIATQVGEINVSSNGNVLDQLTKLVAK